MKIIAINTLKELIQDASGCNSPNTVFARFASRRCVFFCCVIYGIGKGIVGSIR